MKLYEYEAFPNPRRVRIFLAEKGIEIPRVQVDVPSGEHRRPEFLSKNPDAGVPVLELDSGETIAETVAISRYIEELEPANPLFGETAAEKARVEMWQRRVEASLPNAVASYFHHATGGLGDERYRNREWGEKNRETAVAAMHRLDAQLAENRFIVGDRFTIADITALCGIDFAIAVGIEVPAGCANLARWYEEVSSRPSAVA